MDEINRKKKDEIQESIKEKGARWTAGDNPIAELSEEEKKNRLGLVRSKKTEERLERKKT